MKTNKKSRRCNWKIFGAFISIYSRHRTICDCWRIAQDVAGAILTATKRPVSCT